VHPRHSFRQSHFLLDGPSFLVFSLGDDVVRVRRHQVILVLVVLLDLLSGAVRAGPYDDRSALPQGENASSSSLAVTGSVAVAGGTITTVPQGARYGLIRIVKWDGGADPGEVHQTLGPAEDAANADWIESDRSVSPDRWRKRV
jgi:hypothetical protein